MGRCGCRTLGGDCRSGCEATKTGSTTPSAAPGSPSLAPSTSHHLQAHTCSCQSPSGASSMSTCASPCSCSNTWRSTGREEGGVSTRGSMHAQTAGACALHRTHCMQPCWHGHPGVTDERRSQLTRLHHAACMQTSPPGPRKSNSVIHRQCGWGTGSRRRAASAPAGRRRVWHEWAVMQEGRQMHAMHECRLAPTTPKII